MKIARPIGDRCPNSDAKRKPAVERLSRNPSDYTAVSPEAEASDEGAAGPPGETKDADASPAGPLGEPLDGVAGPGRTLVERALELAGDGRHRSLPDIRASLKREGYVNAAPHLAGKSINASILERIRSAPARTDEPTIGIGGPVSASKGSED